MSEHEVWKDYTGSIKQFHGYIKVSNLGRIYKKGENTSKNNSKILKCSKNSFGYMRVHVSIKGKQYNKSVHRLVAETFCENPYKKPYVDHINAIRNDNRASNLRWVTTAENCHNPIYLKKLGERLSNQLNKNNYLKKSLEKKVVAENKNGEKLYFGSIKDLQKHFDTKANVSRKIKSGDYFTSSKSKMCGWKIRLL